MKASRPGPVPAAAQIVARIERLPFTRFHLKARIVIGTATFFDAFDALAIAYVLPALIPLWKLTPAAIGGLISTGYIGQLIGAMVLGWVAENRGRKFSLLISVATLTVFSGLSALSWSYSSLLAFRFLQGIGLGGEVPVAAAYINEISSAKRRGRFVLFYEIIFPIGLMSAALAGWWIVPHWGWRALLLIGALPGPLILPLRWMLPESPRWLADRGRLEEADAVVSSIEKQAEPVEEESEIPPVELEPVIPGRSTRLAELFEGVYLRRSLVVWVLWFAAYFATYGIATWLPSIYTAVFKLPLAQALRYSLLTSCVTLIGTVCCALLIDRTGRKPWFTGVSLGGGLLLLVLWRLGARSALQVLVFTTAAHMVFNTMSLALYLYTPELYPTRMRALGTSVGTAWVRIASAIGPTVMAFVVSRSRLAFGFFLFGVVLIAAGCVNWRFGTETKGRILEEISP